MVKAQNLLTLALGATTIATNSAKLAQDAKLIVDKIGLVTTNLITAAVGEEAIAKASEAAATGAATAAQKTLNAALAAAPYALILTAIVAVVAALGNSTSAAKLSQAATESLNRSVEDLNESYDSFLNFQNSIFDALEKQKTLTGNLTEEQKLWRDELASSAGLNADQIDALEKQGINALKLTVALGTLTSQNQELGKASTQALANLNELANESFDGTLGAVREYIDNLEKVKTIEGELDETDTARLSAAQAYLKIKQDENKVQDQILLKNLQIENLEGERLAKAKEDSKKASEEYRKRQDDIKRILKETANETIQAELEAEFRIREIRNDSQKNLEIQEKEALQIDFERNQAKIKQAQDKALEELKAKKASGDQIAELEKYYAEQNIALTEITKAEETAIEKKYTDERLLIRNVLNKEILFGDFNLNDRRRKIALDNADFENEQRIKSYQNTLEAHNLTLNATKDLIEKIRVAKDMDAELEKAKKLEELEFQKVQDEETARAKFEQGLIDEIQYQDAISAIRGQYRQGEKEADAEFNEAKRQNAIESTQIQTDEETKVRNAYFESSKQSIVALQGFSDFYFAIRMANVKKGSAEEEKAARNQFKINKGLAIAQATISTIQGVINALTAQSVIPEPAGTILKIASAVAIGAAGAANIAKIAAKQFDAGGGGATIPSAPSESAASSAPAAPIIQAASTGGFTSFAPGLVNNPTGGQTSNGSSTSPDGQRVYVVESDITNSQRRVSVAEQSATF